MKVRAIDTNNDWTYGKGKSNYKSRIEACAQNIKTRMQSFLGDCFYATADGLDWFKFMGGKSTPEFKLAVVAILIKTPDVKSVVEVTVNLNTSRRITLTYSVETIYGPLQRTVTQEV